ncbi:hypothetical protein HMSSN036_16270 [Paenibacillus macerans]|nr:hypothetical protein HMSSN036_16270 [Paenibacillus macerans]
MKNLLFSKIAKTTLVAASLAAVLQTVPVHADAVHTAEEGDTFYLLAKKYGVGMEQLMNANQGIDPGNIYEGLKVDDSGNGGSRSESSGAGIEPGSRGKDDESRRGVGADRIAIGQSRRSLGQNV